jgi:hypothetical protein
MRFEMLQFLPCLALGLDGSAFADVRIQYCVALREAALVKCHLLGNPRMSADRNSSIGRVLRDVEVVPDLVVV